MTLNGGANNAEKSLKNGIKVNALVAATRMKKGTQPQIESTKFTIKGNSAAANTRETRSTANEDTNSEEQAGPSKKVKKNSKVGRGKSGAGKGFAGQSSAEKLSSKKLADNAGGKKRKAESNDRPAKKQKGHVYKTKEDDVESESESEAEHQRRKLRRRE